MVRLADVDRDGRLDVVTGWEEGGRVRVYLQPPASALRRTWPAVTGSMSMNARTVAVSCTTEESSSRETMRQKGQAAVVIP